ncbi:Uncharacterized protein GBIM_02604 [Gryllus bimaculatus]|nr:Uncharacterized protein GBIM_02604 [Gryllus bimaculatus]
MLCLVWRGGRPPARKGKDSSEPGSKRKFVCVVCGAAYSHAKSLSSHLRYHAGETECHLCHKVLSRRTHVTRHLMVKHGIKLPSRIKKEQE